MGLQCHGCSELVGFSLGDYLYTFPARARDFDFAFSVDIIRKENM